MKNGWKNSEAEFFISSNDELSENFRKFYHSFFNRQKFENFDYVSEKVPKNILVAHSLMEIFPDAYFINIYRDGRDVLASHYQIMQREKSTGTFNINNICLEWNMAIEASKAIEKSGIYKNRFFNMKYENLISEPELVIKSLCAFLNIDVEEQLLHPERINNSASVFAVGVWHSQENLSQSFMKDNFNRWKKILPMVMKVMANFRMSDNLEYLGYEISPVYTYWRKIKSSIT